MTCKVASTSGLGQAGALNSAVLVYCAGFGIYRGAGIVWPKP